MGIGLSIFMRRLVIQEARQRVASAAKRGESLLIVRSLLGHKRVATTERYAHLGDDPVKRAAQQVGRSIAGWLAASDSQVKARD